MSSPRRSLKEKLTWAEYELLASCVESLEVGLVVYLFHLTKPVIWHAPDMLAAHLCLKPEAVRGDDEVTLVHHFLIRLIRGRICEQLDLANGPLFDSCDTGGCGFGCKLCSFFQYLLYVIPSVTLESRDGPVR